MKQELLNKKQNDVVELKERFSKAKTIIVFDYQGLTDEQNKDVRKKLRSQHTEMKIYKNNIARRAAAAAGYDELVSSLAGPKAIAISYSDPVAPAKVLFEYAKTNNKVRLTAGVVEGKVIGVDSIIELATLPTREVLLTQLAVGLLAPLTQLALGLNLIEK
ncbi:MAG: 50S ribosomal protein L10 [Acholeplasmatales bacterium]|jgi:large subunit ribosomal protein L10|nr:50S ribosomal protein L10 [Acholeplasmatales bacterium]